MFLAEVLKTAQDFPCDICDEAKRPKVPRPAQVPRLHDWNQRFGFDILDVLGWAPRTKVKMTNHLDFAAIFQQVPPMLVAENSVEIRWNYGNWTQSAKPPKEMVVDSAKQHVGLACMSIS